MSSEKPIIPEVTPHIVIRPTDDPNKADYHILLFDKPDQEQIKQMVLEQVQKEYWFMQSYWKEKGRALEQIILKLVKKVSLFITSTQKRHLQKNMRGLWQIRYN